MASDVGADGNYGVATLTARSDGTARMTLELAELAPSAVVPVTLATGTCTKAGRTLVKGVSVYTTIMGTGARVATLSKSQLTSFRTATKGSGKVALRVGPASLKACGVFAPWTPPSPVVLTVPISTLWFTLTLPAGWASDPDDPAATWSGLGLRHISYNDSWAVHVTGGRPTESLDIALRFVLDFRTGDPDYTLTRAEGILVGDRPSVMLTYDIVHEGISYMLYDAVVAGDGPAVEIMFFDLAGTQAADRTLFLGILGTFQRVPSATSGTQ